MSNVGAAMVGNEFTLPTKRLQISKPPIKIQLERGGGEVPAIPVEAISQTEMVQVTTDKVAKINTHSSISRFLETIHSHSLITFALLFLLVGASGIEVGSSYWAAQLDKPLPNLVIKKSSVSMNISVPADELSSKVASITNQAATLNVGTQVVKISPDSIKSWLNITPSVDHKTDYISISPQSIRHTLFSLANKFAVAPFNQISVNHSGTDQIIYAGKNGMLLSDPSSLTTQANLFAKSVMSSNGLNFQTPLVIQPFQAVTAASIGKLIEVNVNTHQMYLYDNGNLTKTYAISAGAPVTPTPIGEFKIWEKLTQQTMTGHNPNGSKYIQPNVQWINYFDHSGDAVHGNYWRPSSVFGNVNTSHGCVSLPNDEAQWVYNWAPIGTTVINHY